MNPLLPIRDLVKIGNNGPIITVIMGSLLRFIITKITGNNDVITDVIICKNNVITVVIISNNGSVFT